MISLSNEPFSRTVLRLVSAGVLSCVASTFPAFAQDSAAPPADASAAPADAAPVETPAANAAAAPADASAAPADAAAPPAEGTAAAADQTPASPETTASQPYEETVPVDAATSSEEAPAAGSADATKLEKVEVTGSRIKRTDYETAQPVTAITRKDIERTGVATLGELLQSLPSAGSALNTTFNNGGTGATEIDLRNLGSARVLVLVNGHRWVSGLRSLSTSSVDLNTIPIAIIDRIEVLQDGASAIYGSDAIAGVVNIITRKDYQGAMLSLQGGAYTEGADGAQQSHSISFGNLFGTALGHTSAFASFAFEDEKAIPTYDRDISRLPKQNTGLTRASGFLPDSRILWIPNPVSGAVLGTTKCPGLQSGVVNGALDDPGGTIGDPFTSGSLPPVPIQLPGSVDQIPGLQLCDIKHIPGASADPLFYSDYKHYDPPGDSYNYAQDNLVSTPLRTYGGFIGLNHKFDNLDLPVLKDLTFTFEGLYNYRQSRQMLAPQPTCSGEACPIIGGGLDENGISINQRTYLSINNPYNPFHDDIGRSYGDTGLYGTGAVLFRPVQIGRRIQEQHVPTFYVRPALSGALDIFGQMLNWEGGFGYGQSQQHEWLYNQIRLDHVQLGLGDPANCTGDCVPLDFVHGSALTDEMIRYITFTGVDDTKQQQQDGFFNLSTSIDQWWAGPLGIAAGVEYRRDHYEFRPDEFSRTGISAGLFSDPTSGSVTAKEAFLEFDIPLLRDIPVFKEVEVNVAGRISQYKTFGQSKNGKVGLRWKPYDDLLLRGTYSSSFRAPNVGDLYLGQTQSFPALADPCVDREPGSNADVNCSADGVPEDAPQNNLQIVSPFKGNPDLKPEYSHSFSAGFVFSPSFARGLDVAVDFFRIYINDFITAPGGQFILDNCYNSDPNYRQYCDRISRKANGEVQLVINTFENVAKFITGGADFNVGWTLPTQSIPGMADAGKFKLIASATFLASYDQFTNSLDPSQPQQKAGLTGQNLGDNAYPRWKINPQLVYSNGGLEAVWTTRIVWHNTEACDDGIDPSLVTLGVCSDPTHENQVGTLGENKLRTVAKHDVQIGYRWAPSKFSIGLGAQNIFNTDPPTSYSAFANSFDASDYWMPGTLIYAKVQKEW